MRVAQVVKPHVSKASGCGCLLEFFCNLVWVQRIPVGTAKDEIAIPREFLLAFPVTSESFYRLWRQIYNPALKLRLTPRLADGTTFL